MAASNWRQRPEDDEEFPQRRQTTWRKENSGSPYNGKGENLLGTRDGKGEDTHVAPHRRGFQTLGGMYDRFNRGKDTSPSNWRERQPQRTGTSSFERGDTRQDESRWRERGRGRFQGSIRHRTEMERRQGGSDFRDFYASTKREMKRQSPITRRQLENLLKMEADLVVLELLREQLGYRNFLQQDSIRSEHIFLVTAVLRRACLTKASMQNLHELFIITCEQKFLDKLCAFCMTVKRQYPDKASDFFKDLYEFLDAYANAFTTNAIDKISDLVDTCISVLTNLQVQELVSEEILIKYKELQKMLTKAKEKWIHAQTNETKVGRRGFEMDNMEPPDNFRELPVIPVPYDFSTKERPFLRRNIVEGKYIDEEHYLDVQFRLLREDFVRPLRNGINDIKDGVKTIRDIRIYRNVVMFGSQLTNGKLIHLVQLNLPRKIMIQTSKRLLYGNLLCFTNDNFKSMFLASVAERNAEMLKEGVIGITFETNISDINMSGKFLMVESRSYFMAYKHVLQALKGFSAKGFPMTSYIIRVDCDIKLPSYLEMHSHYDLRVVKEMKMMKKKKVQSKLVGKPPSKELLIEGDDRWPELNHVPMCEGVESWPSNVELGLDESQCKALHGALTRELAIIQGPPGTGKTFLGLKITQILLHNSQAWTSESYTAPILVVCFTNHALDQFLEGMTAFTKSIVRVGSRSKNETISKFQVNMLARNLRSLRETPISIHFRIRELTNEVEEYEREIKYLRDIEYFCVHPNGIMKLEILLSEDIIPPYMKEQLIQGDQRIMSWLFSSCPLDDYDTLNSREESTQKEGEYIKNSDGEKSDDDLLEAQDQLLQLEEEDRRLDMEDVQDKRKGKEKERRVLYEITFGVIEEEMKSLTNKDIDQDEYYYYLILTNQWKFLSIGFRLPERPSEMRDLERQNINIWMLDFQTRWLLYRFWLSKLHQKIKQKLSSLETNYQQKATALQEVKCQEHLHIMRNAAVVGMTTTGAAQYSAVMQDLAPAIVIIEEAAEILESHVITSLTTNCQHLILIGDHQQLQPSATVYELATKYGLETSLFERMIKNGLPYECLEYQHRMRPSISRLLVPSIYPTLKDHTSVTAYPHIKGVAKDMFFISHQIHEKEESDDNNSHENLHEAEFIMALCRHLLLQGYASGDITILAPYSGQFFLLKKLQQEHPICNDVRISVVDNFQGEENKIILLSLVRSNAGGKVGFLRTENRVCVALSRAREGLYIIGNMDLLSASSKLWQHIKEDLEAEGNIGRSLPIRCENHPEVLESVSTGKDFYVKSPEGGCLRLCNKSLPCCDHICKKMCHMQDHDHTMYKCREPCPNVLCSLGHPCPRLCWQACKSCEVLLRKTLPCDHTHDIPCSIDPEGYDCPTLVNKILPDCRHEALIPCHEKTENWTCPMDCDTRLDCGHMCRQKCHAREDPEHRQYNCLQSCTRLNAGCTQNHPCQKKCYEDCGSCVKEVSKVLPCGHTANKVQCHIAPETVKCMENCKRTLSCGHSCKNVCHKPCGNCAVKVKKIIPSCQHTISIECGQEATTNKCDGSCPKKLSCGHACLKKCNQPCTTKCEVKILSSAKCPKNHSITIPCYLRNEEAGEELWIHCDNPCGETLDCGHTCEGKCNRCFQGRVHESCKKPCGRMQVCGHICKYLCSISCPPCGENCERRCSHRRCEKLCRIPCTPCKKPCERSCKHVECNKRCGEMCKVKPCDKPCDKNLKCGHPCIGFCGDPCPPLCRTCDADKLTDAILKGSEHDQDTRFVLLEDCGHCIDVKGLEEWLERDEAEIFMKTCPRCGKPIYNNLRYKNIIFNVHKTKEDVRQKHFTMIRSTFKKEDIEDLLSNIVMVAFPSEVKKLQIKIRGRKADKFFVGPDLQLYHFQASVLKKASKILFEQDIICNDDGKKLKNLIDLLVNRAMQSTQIIPQVMEDITCELQRLTILEPYWYLVKIGSRVKTGSKADEIVATLEKLMDPTVKFDSVTEKKFRKIWKSVEDLEIPKSKKITMVMPMSMTRGQWYKCPNRHVFCRREGIRTLKCSVCGAAVRGVDENCEANTQSDSSESSSDESSSDENGDTLFFKCFMAVSACQT